MKVGYAPTKFIWMDVRVPYIFVTFQVADMAVADLSINYDRESAVDFSSTCVIITYTLNSLNCLCNFYWLSIVIIVIINLFFHFYSAFYESWDQYPV